MSEVTDLDILVPDNKNVTLGGRSYTLPGDLPMEVFLRMNAAGDVQEDNQIKALERLLDALGDLFAWLAPVDRKQAIKDEAIGVLKGRGVKFLMQLIQNVYTADEDDVAVEPEASPTEETTGTPSTTS